MSHTVERGVVHCGDGIPQTPRWFSDNRLSFQFDGKSITQIDYYNPVKTRGSHVMFLQRLWEGFRWYIEQEKITYRPDYTRSRIWPFGLESEWSLAGANLQFRLLAVDDAIVIQIETLDDFAAEARFKLEFYQNFGLIPADTQDLRYAGENAQRKWQDWQFDEAKNRFQGGYWELPRAKTKISEKSKDDISLNNPELAQEERMDPEFQAVGISADFPISLEERHINVKYVLIGKTPLQPGRTYSFVIHFAPTAEESDQKASRLLPDLKNIVDRQFRRYEDIIARSPVLKSPYPELNDFIGMAPLYHESCKVVERPGAIKAKTANYWVWGWDGMTSNYASLYWGDETFIRDMLRFYEDTADPERGIGHCYRNDMGLYMASSLPAQSMYVSLLQQYYAMTGDIDEVRQRYPFARRVFDRIRGCEAGHTGLCEGASLFPDFPAFMQETGSDISGFNNTIYYSGVRSMEYLAELVGDEDTKRTARDIFERIEAAFLPLFFSEERGFVVSSVDAKTLEPRASFNANAVKWESSYCAELMAPVNARCLDFFESNIVCRAGLREIPVWSDAYDGDANQLHCWWPVTGEYYMRLINGQDRPDLVRQWVGWISYWTSKLMCPEGVPCYIDTDEPEADRWTALSGAWHAYSVRGWYQAALHGVVGVGLEAGGLTFYPYSGEEMTLEGLPYRGKLFDIEMRGSGPWISAIEADDCLLLGTHKLPVDIGPAGERTRIVVHRTAHHPNEITLLHGYGIDLMQYRCDQTAIRAHVAGAGTGRLTLAAASEPKVSLCGMPLEVRYDSAVRRAEVTLRLAAGKTDELEISL